MDNKYCRFCANLKSSHKLLNLENEQEICTEVLSKLSFLNAMYVDVSNDDNSLPRTVCLVCYEALNKAYDFLAGVKKAQDILTEIFLTQTKPFNDSDDDLDNVDDLSPLQNSPKPTIKHEPVATDGKNQGIAVEIKAEPDADTMLEEAISSLQTRPPNDIDQTLNVQEFLDAAIGKAFTPDVTIYAKEVKKKELLTWKDYQWVCAYCNMEFLDMDMLRSHSKVVHKKCGAFSCIDCKYFGKHTDFNRFITHVKKHRKWLKNYCHYCDIHIEKQNLAAHVKQHISESQQACPHCGDILDEESIKPHIKDFNSVKPSRKPPRKRGAPITIEELTCPICNKVYKNLNSRRDHIKRHTDNRKKDYTCERCGKMFYNKGTLTCHIMAHDKIKPHKCKICNTAFQFPNMLRRHVLMHSGVKPYSCEQCGRCFRLQYQLNAHKIIHTDSMPYVCLYCNKAFRFKQILKNHELQHTGAKPYSCQHCTMEFTNWSNYNKHMKRRHNTDTSKKKITPEGVFPINPETGQIMQLQDAEDTEEWRTKIMLPVKRGKKKVIKQEMVS